VTDGSSRSSSGNNETLLPLDTPDVETIRSNLNMMFEQACIVMTTNTSSGERDDVHYDSGAIGNSDGYMNSEASGDSECKEVNKLAVAKLNVMIVSQLKQTSENTPGD